MLMSFLCALAAALLRYLIFFFCHYYKSLAIETVLFQLLVTLKKVVNHLSINVNSRFLAITLCLINDR